MPIVHLLGLWFNRDMTQSNYITETEVQLNRADARGDTEWFYSILNDATALGYDVECHRDGWHLIPTW